MKDHDILGDVLKEKELLEKIAPKSLELSDLDVILEQSENPKVLAAVMFRLMQERERTNKLLESINEKYDKIMFSLKTNPLETQNATNTIQGNTYEVLAEQDQTILKMIEERGGCSANDIKIMMNYKGLNAACQRLNKLYMQGHLKKIKAGKKVLYLAKS